MYPALLSGWASYIPHGGNESSYMNHGFAMLSAVLKRAGHEPFLVDMRSLNSWEHFEQLIRTADYEFAMMTWLSCDDASARQAAAIMKRTRPDKFIVAGGIHLSVTQATEYPNIDSIVRGEGEEHILEIAQCIEAGRHPGRIYTVRPVPDLDTLPFVDRNFFNPEMEETSPLLPLLPEPFITIVAGRGCWGKCTFCAPSRELISGRKIRIRTPEHFIEEICLLNSRPGGIGSLMIHDDLLGSKSWMARFIDLWRSRLPRIPFFCQLRADTILRMRELIPDLADIGLTWVSLGLESGSQRMLDFLQKGVTVEQNIEASEILHNNRVNIFANYILGLPTETKEDLDATERMLSIIKPEWHSASTYTSYPGSYLYEWIQQNDYWVSGDEHYSRIRYPYERMIRGVDYDEVRRRFGEWNANYKSALRGPRSQL